MHVHTAAEKLDPVQKVAQVYVTDDTGMTTMLRQLFLS